MKSDVKEAKNSDFIYSFSVKNIDIPDPANTPQSTLISHVKTAKRVVV